MTGEPYPKERQLQRYEQRSWRVRADRAEMARLRQEKMQPCRVCIHLGKQFNGGFRYEVKPLELHHLVPRSWGGDDVADNLVMLCRQHHGRATDYDAATLAALAASLTDSEYAYCIDKLGEGALERLFGVMGR